MALAVLNHVPVTGSPRRDVPQAERLAQRWAKGLSSVLVIRAADQGC